MTAERRKEISNAYKSQEQKKLKTQNEAKILLPIYKKIQIILREKSLKKLESLSANLAKRLNA